MDIGHITLLVLLIGAAAACLWLFLRRQEAITEASNLRLQNEADIRLAAERLAAAENLAAERTRAAESIQRQATEDRAAFELRIREGFAALAAETLRGSAEQLVQRAGEVLDSRARAADTSLHQRHSLIDQTMKSITEALSHTRTQLSEMQRDRAAEKADLSSSLRRVLESGDQLRVETGRLVQSLKRPEVRGRWGEIQLARVAELAGMKAYCEFTSQESMRDENGRLLRPDMIVRLPNKRCIAVDAKTNIGPYVDAIEAQNPEQQEALLERFAQGVTEQVAALSTKAYWRLFEDSPEIVVMFIPGDQFIDAVLQRRPDLIEKAANARVILASPSTLIGLLRAVAIGWRERKVEEQAKDLFELGRELHERATAALTYMVKLGTSLNSAVDRYNEFVGSYVSRLEPTLRKFEEVGAASAKVLPDLSQIEIRTRSDLPMSLWDATPQNGAAGADDARLA